MNCTECGHDTDEHGEYGCFHPTGNPKDVECNCSIKKTKLLYIELAAWKAEAMTAREWIYTLELGVNFVYKTAPQRVAYFAARVKDE